MKYLKTFENDDYIPKFKIGDFVKIRLNYSWKHSEEEAILPEIYIIKHIDMGARNQYLIQQYQTKETPIWRNQNSLLLVPDYELASIKYNL
jgi:hypothetical protein